MPDTHLVTPIAEPSLNDPLIALIAKVKPLENEETRLRNIADTAFFALPDEVKKPLFGGGVSARFNLPCGDLYRALNVVREQTDALFDKITSTKATTLDGLIAQAEYLDCCDEHPIILAGLRNLDVKADDGSAILAAFRQWIEEGRVMKARARELTDDEYELALDCNYHRALEIAAIPVTGAADLAVKIYLAWHGRVGSGRRDEAALSDDLWKDDSPGWMSTRLEIAIAEDVGRLVPELKPFLEEALAVGRSAQAEFDRDEPVIASAE